MDEIAYQNKDIASKVFAEQFAGKSFEVYGVPLPKVKQVLPTNLPTIKANELRLDDLFLLEDHTLLLVDYESVYKPEHKLKYLGYVLRILERYQKEYGFELQISILILYTSDVSETQTKDMLDVGAVTMKVKQAFLSKLDSEAIWKKIEGKVKRGESLSDQELMQIIVLPLTYPGTEQKKKSIEQLFTLMKEMKDEETQLFVLSGLLVFTDKVIGEETAKKIKEWIRMTKVARLFEEEKEEAVREALQAAEQAALQAAEQAAEQEARETAKEMLKQGVAMEVILRCVKRVNMLELEKLQKELEIKS